MSEQEPEPLSPDMVMAMALVIERSFVAGRAFQSGLKNETYEEVEANHECLFRGDGELWYMNLKQVLTMVWDRGRAHIQILGKDNEGLAYNHLRADFKEIWPLSLLSLAHSRH